jgi:hypothetical protein
VLDTTANDITFSLGGEREREWVLRLLRCYKVDLTTGMQCVTPSPESMTVPVRVRSPTWREVHDAASARTAWSHVYIVHDMYVCMCAIVGRPYQSKHLPLMFFVNYTYIIQTYIHTHISPAHTHTHMCAHTHSLTHTQTPRGDGATLTCTAI